jgi:hypothetical protein
MAITVSGIFVYGKTGYMYGYTSLCVRICSKHSIFRYDNFIGCFSADKIKMSARKYFCFNIPIHYCPVKVDK